MAFSSRHMAVSYQEDSASAKALKWITMCEEARTRVNQQKNTETRSESPLASANVSI
jgi:hypothetical protein